MTYPSWCTEKDHIFTRPLWRSERDYIITHPSGCIETDHIFPHHIVQREITQLHASNYEMIGITWWCNPWNAVISLTSSFAPRDAVTGIIISHAPRDAATGMKSSHNPRDAVRGITLPSSGLWEQNENQHIPLVNVPENMVSWPDTLQDEAKFRSDICQTDLTQQFLEVGAGCSWNIQRKYSNVTEQN